MKFTLFSTALLASSIATAAPAVNGWYLSAFGGVSDVMSNINTRHFGPFISQVDYNTGYNAGGRLGFQSNPIRYELEYTYIHADAERFKVNHISQTAVSGNVSANLIMANLYYDFPEFLATISPFVGVGIGYAFMQTDLTGNGPYAITFLSETNNAFAYQGTAGLTYNFSENYAINGSYRYTATTNSGHLGRSFQTQMGDVGVIYRFDTVTYK